jgi:Transposase, Mutator family
VHAFCADPVVFFDALRAKIRDEGVARNKAIHLVLGVPRDGTRDVLCLWIEQTEGAKFWLRVESPRILHISDLTFGYSASMTSSDKPHRSGNRFQFRWLRHEHSAAHVGELGSFIAFLANHRQATRSTSQDGYR